MFVVVVSEEYVEYNNCCCLCHRSMWSMFVVVCVT